MDRKPFIECFPFDEIRPQQELVLNKLKDNWSKYKYFVLEIPTGGGKSALAKTIGASTGSAFLVTASKQLQDQYTRDFKETDGVVSIKGKANYPCKLQPELNVECGLCVGKPEQLRHCKDHNFCHYYKQRDKALFADIALTSYHYFLYSCLCGGFWTHRDVLILDEVHELEGILVEWAKIKISPAKLAADYQLKIPKHQLTSGYKNNADWLDKVYNLITKKRNKLYKELVKQFKGKQQQDFTADDIDEILTNHKEYYEIDKLFKSFDIFFSDPNPEQWLVEPEDDGLLLTPIGINGIFERFVAPWADKIIFMSATILDLKGFCNDLKLSKEQTALLRIESDFPPEHSPINYLPVGDMSYNKLDGTIPYIVEQIKELLVKHSDEKGIIHTGNYKIAQAIIDNIDDDRLLMRQEGENNGTLMLRHIDSDRPTVLVSPSLAVGADLYDNLSRFQVIVKLPWKSLADKRVNLKSKLDPKWYAAEMFRTFVQASGRSTRSAEDWSTTYVLDGKFKYWVWNARSYLPKQFIKRIKWENNN